MCGKFTQMMSWSAYVRLADLVGAPQSPLEVVMPMRYATVLALDGNGKRAQVKMRWGLVPPWQKDPDTSPRYIHARAEGIEEKPTYRDAFLHRRGLLIVRTFNEGEDVGSKTIQHTITPRDGLPMAIAVIWERWHEAHGGTLLTFAMVTVAANKLITPITDRMPAVLQGGDWGKWLGEEPATAEELKTMLQPFEGAWDMAPEKPAKSPPPPKPKPQPDLL